MAERIGLFGGTFDPVHFGHLAVAESFLNSGYIDSLWILLAPNPPHKKTAGITDFSHRKEMLEAAFSELDNVKISDVERGLSQPSYTVQTIKYLKSQFPDYKFYLCIGEDSLKEFKDWRQPGDILNECELLVAERPNVDTWDVDDQILEKVHFIKHEPVAVSSTELRVQLENRQDVSDYIPDSVLRIIKKHNFYQ